MSGGNSILQGRLDLLDLYIRHMKAFPAAHATQTFLWETEGFVEPPEGWRGTPGGVNPYHEKQGGYQRDIILRRARASGFRVETFVDGFSISVPR